MKVLLGFIVFVFVLSAILERRGRDFPFVWLFAITAFIAASFYSLRVLL